jgi:GT2 family glycosyltransferase
MGFIYGYDAGSGVDSVSFAEGMAFALRNQVISDVGLLDGSYYMMYDDVDYSWRTRLMGWDIILEPRSIVYHYRGGTIGKNFENMDPKFITLATKNHLTTLLKNTEFHNLILTLPLAIFIKALESVYLMLKVNLRKGLMNTYGIVSTFFNMHHVLRKRYVIQTTRKITDRQLFKSFHAHDLKMLVQGSILANPYTRGRMRKSNEEPILFKKGA